MCIHSQDYETCRFGCTFRKKEELKLENDRLKEVLLNLKNDFIIRGEFWDKEECESLKKWHDDIDQALKDQK